MGLRPKGRHFKIVEIYKMSIVLTIDINMSYFLNNI